MMEASHIGHKTFFDSQPYTLIPKKKECCSHCPFFSISASPQRDKTILKVVMVTNLLFGLINLFSFFYDMNRRPLGDRIVNLATALILPSFFLFMYYIFNQIRKTLTEKDPALPYYQGSLISTPSVYEIRQGNTNNEELCMPLVHACFKDLVKRDLLDLWLKSKESNSLEKAASDMFKVLGNGLCYGYSMALLAMMLENYKTSSAELMEKINFETVYYYQFMHQAIISLLNDKTLAEFSKILLNTYPLEKVNTSSYNHLFLLLQNIDFNSILFNESKYVDLTKTDPEEIETYFFNGLKEMEANLANNSTDFTIAGTIVLRESEDNLKKEGSHPGHSLFFQFSDDHYRFHDSGSEIAGFFEFPDDKLFFEKLLEHIQSWPKYKDGRLRICLLGIPRENTSQEIRIDIKDS